ncbi:platelet-derived growth factor C isoform X1 [Bos indicus x Bos taurus]|uniref:Platelet-derived growth factor C n=2 Tax=Bos TaxID=9903 RepID=A0AAA9TR33_BOVIN|nr:platelet-derived growth factor C isoform X1 [Bos taurus]XP_006078273.2 platelet-derived growth factor C isoform X3 [Bubalus bubalis]XP_019833398.1 PREDICTED: platelet-derived growth factor C isoform X1 [Bos indicus]XP_024833386.1 platelet-derived growth factor C isoform X1 [Bos taurus]XP_027423014.1 platelet-derived growth factor C isoform X1 [Bos indicus x Bos taurus]XP_055405509.1 platelet-derived growth factor C isoform X1 [Bubalus carabanensis]XP_061240328.1 platelet-derived growth fac
MGVCGKCPARLGGQSRRGASRPARPSPGGADPGPEPRSPSARRPRARPLSPMLLFGLLLLTSALAGQRPGTRAESNLSSKLQLASNKEQNGVQDPQHERIITVSTNGSIHSPRFPHTYPRNMDLVWRLVAVEENVWIQLTFDERFGLEDPEDDICKYDFVEVEEPSDGTILGRWCGSGSVPGKQISKGNQIRIRFVSDEYFPSEPGFCIHYNIVMPQLTETVSPSSLPASALPLDLLNNAVTAFSTLEDLIRYLEPDRWQLDLEDLYRPTSLQLLGKNFVFGRKSRVVDLNLLKEEVRLYSCTPRNFSVSVREELKRTDTIFWPGCLLVKRCGGNCACCLHTCSECQCVPSKVTKKYHEVLQLRPKTGVRGLHKSLTDVALEHHEECDCVCRGNPGG